MQKLFLSAVFITFGTALFAGSSAAPIADKVERLKRLGGGGHIIRVSGCLPAGEELSGSNKICYYTCATGTEAVSVGVAELCPLSM